MARDREKNIRLQLAREADPGCERREGRGRPYDGRESLVNGVQILTCHTGVMRPTGEGT